MLPEDQGQELIDLWQEFEAGETADAKFAVSVDRLHPLLHNYVTGGGSWKRHTIKRSQVEKRMLPVRHGSQTLDELITEVLDDSVNKNILLAG